MNQKLQILSQIHLTDCVMIISGDNIHW